MRAVDSVPFAECLDVVREANRLPGCKGRTALPVGVLGRFKMRTHLQELPDLVVGIHRAAVRHGYFLFDLQPVARREPSLKFGEGRRNTLASMT